MYDTNHSRAMSQIPSLDVSLVAKMSWLIVTKAAEKSSNKMMEPYLDEAVLCNYRVCV